MSVVHPLVLSIAHEKKVRLVRLVGLLTSDYRWWQEESKGWLREGHKGVFVSFGC
jgi:hypothetical protein